MQSIRRYFVQKPVYFSYRMLVLGFEEWYQITYTSVFNSSIKSELSSQHGIRKRMYFAVV